MFLQPRQQSRCRARSSRDLPRWLPGAANRGPGPADTSSARRRDGPPGRSALPCPRGGGGSSSSSSRSTYPMSCRRRASVSCRERCAGLMAALAASEGPGRCRLPAGRSAARESWCRLVFGSGVTAVAISAAKKVPLP